MLDNRIETHRSWCHGGTTSAPVLGDVRLTNLGPLLGLLEVLLGLPELGQVDGGDLLRFLDLLLVSIEWQTLTRTRIRSRLEVERCSEEDTSRALRIWH